LTIELTTLPPDTQGTQPLKYLIEPMELRHIPAVSAIEKESFTSSWPSSAYRREIERNQMAHYFVARRGPSAGELRRPRRFPITGEDIHDEEDGILARLVRLIRGEARTFAREEAEELESIVGYTGMWMMLDEAHITTIAVDPAYRGEGIGELLLVSLIDHASFLGATEVTLECRVSNHVAQALYRKYTFRNAGLRKRYYSDDGEDALIMTTEPLDAPIFQQVLEANRQTLVERLKAR
jgi:[ribosomal protein S18]-alanine N-acetyltransferase